jgi:hypothetical protein
MEALMAAVGRTAPQPQPQPQQHQLHQQQHQHHLLPPQWPPAPMPQQQYQQSSGSWGWDGCGGEGGGGGRGGIGLSGFAAQAAAGGEGDDDVREPSRPLMPQGKAERRKEKAREYSRVARRRQEGYVNELRGRVEMLGVYHYLIEECGPDLVLHLSPDMQARVLFANGLAGRALGVDPRALIGQCVLCIGGVAPVR